MVLWSDIVVKKEWLQGILLRLVGGGCDVQGELRLDDSFLVKDSLFTVQEFMDRLIL